MNDITMNQLKVIVEGAVRPVRASTCRKRRMREELLAHVSAAFEEEAKLSDERTALERTGQRFGNPNELAGQLQESVPASDGIHCLLDKLWFRPGEPKGRRLLRYGTLYSLILMVVLPTWYVWVQLSYWLARATQWPVEEPKLLGGPVLLLDVFFFALTSLILIWGLVSMDHEMTARIRSQQDWANLDID
jgi:hypothetical protein